MVAINGETLSEYVSSESVVPAHMNIHYALEGIRSSSSLGSSGPEPVQSAGGPRVLVLGHGRTTLAKTLLNYAVRQGRHPLWVDIDPLNGSLVFPGALSATVLENQPIWPSEEVNSPNILTYFFGSVSSVSVESKNALFSVADSPKHYKILLEKLASSVSSKLAVHPLGKPTDRNSLAEAAYVHASATKDIHQYVM